MAEAHSDIFGVLARVPEIAVGSPRELDELLLRADRPFVVRQLVADWPLVVAGRKSGREARDYLLRHHRERPVVVAIGQDGSGGRLFYDDAMAMNFRSLKAGLAEVFTQIDARESQPDAPSIYLASIDINEFFSGLREARIAGLGDRSCLASIWMGTRTRIAAHNDTPNNLACVAVGRRRFTLFPPDQFRNLYLGPVDNTPAGRPVSMVDFHAPDFANHPRFREALDHGQLAELEAGDALFIPALWWHHVEGLDPFNVLVNYWWRETPMWLGQPQDALNFAMMAIRDLPEDQKRYWSDMFDHYVFANDEQAVAHIPAASRGVLAPMTAESAGRVRAFLLRALSQ
jgi:hypothetical protein